MLFSIFDNVDKFNLCLFWYKIIDKYLIMNGFFNKI